MSESPETQKNPSRNTLSNFLGIESVENTPSTPIMTSPVPKVIPRQAPAAASKPTASAAQVPAPIQAAIDANIARTTQAQLATYVTMAAEMQNLLKQERARSQHLYQEIKRVQEHYKGVTNQQEEQIQRLEVNHKTTAEAHAAAQQKVTEYTDHINRLRQEMAKVGKNWETIKKLADSKDQFEQLLSKYSDSEGKFQILFDHSNQSIRKVDEMLREIHRRFLLIETSWDIEAKQRKQGDKDLKSSVDRIYSETEAVSGALHSVNQHMGQYEMAIHTLLGQMEKRDRTNQELYRVSKLIQESQGNVEKTLTQIQERQQATPRSHSRTQLVRLARQLASRAGERFTGIENLIQNGFKSVAKSIQADSIMRRLDVLQGNGEASQAALSRVEAQTQVIATSIVDTLAERIQQNQQQLRIDLIEKISSSESAVMNAQEKLRRELDGLKAENELFRSVLLRWMDESRVTDAAASKTAFSIPADASRAPSPLANLLLLKEKKIASLKDELRMANSDSARKQLQLIMDATMMQRDQIAKIIQAK